MPIYKQNTKIKHQLEYLFTKIKVTMHTRISDKIGGVQMLLLIKQAINRLKFLLGMVSSFHNIICTVK